MTQGSWSKVDLINELCAIHGYDSYLEVCSPFTGNMYAGIDRRRLRTCHRLMYRVPSDFSDGLPVDFRFADQDVGDLASRLRDRGQSYSLILVDPFHEYDTSLRDLRLALDLVAPDGTIVVHDCFPPEGGNVSSEEHHGQSWFGVTYKAFVDLVLSEPSLTFQTVDIDCGCAVIRRQIPPSPLARWIQRQQHRLTRRLSTARHGWIKLGNDFSAAFRLLRSHPTELINLISLTDFLMQERQRAVPAYRQALAQCRVSELRLGSHEPAERALVVFYETILLGEPPEREKMQRITEKIRASPFKHAGVLPADFEPLRYIALNSDLFKAEVDPFQHYLEFGHSENRQW